MKRTQLQRATMAAMRRRRRGERLVLLAMAGVARRGRLVLPLPLRRGGARSMIWWMRRSLGVR